MNERLKRIGAGIMLVAATQFSGDGRQQPSSTSEALGATKPGMPTEIVEKEKPLELTISNLVKALQASNFIYSLEISVPSDDEQPHKFLCRYGYDACLWYPPRGGNYPGSGDVRLDSLNFPLTTGSTITINGLEGGTPRFNLELLQKTFNQFGEVKITLQDPENFVEGEYLKGGATFSIENDVSTQPQSLA